MASKAKITWLDANVKFYIPDLSPTENVWSIMATEVVYADAES